MEEWHKVTSDEDRLYNKIYLQVSLRSEFSQDPILQELTKALGEINGALEAVEVST